MEPPEPTTGRSIRLTLVAVGLLALLAVVAFASRSGFGGSSKAAPSPGYVSYAFTAFLIVFVLMIPVAAYIFVIQAREGETKGKSFKSRVVQNFLTFAVFAGIALVVLYLKRHHAHLFNLNTAGLKSLGAKRRIRHGDPAGGYEPTFEWPVLAIALVALTGTG